MLKRWVLLAGISVLGVVFLGAPRISMAEEGGFPTTPAGTDINNINSLQRGARNFMNYCSGCHSLKYLRYNRMAADLKIPEAELVKNLMFTTDKSFETINVAMPADSESWFGKQPPDLSLMARARGTDYLYSFLHGFYADKARPWGVNNLYLPAVAMPHVLQGLQGLQKPVFKTEPDEHGGTRTVLTGVEIMSAGSLKAEEYDQFVRDLVNFLDYAAEPIKAEREALGLWVTLFLLVFFVFAYLLKKEYWKDIH
jgi:ubiquinol-cytochrome c reductase cytochrome c1 subunit